MAYAIRPYRDEDAPPLSELCRAAIQVIGPKAYSPEQVEAWLARHSGPSLYRERAANGSIIFVAVDENDRPVAYTLLETEGHLDRLYTDPNHTRQGLALQLLAEAEHHAREWGLGKLYTEASDLARDTFESAGFVVSHRREFEIDGVPIHNWAMEKAL